MNLDLGDQVVARDYVDFGIFTSKSQMVQMVRMSLHGILILVSVPIIQIRESALFKNFGRQKAVFESLRLPTRAQRLSRRVKK